MPTFETYPGSTSALAICTKPTPQVAGSVVVNDPVNRKPFKSTTRSSAPSETRARTLQDHPIMMRKLVTLGSMDETDIGSWDFLLYSCE